MGRSALEPKRLPDTGLGYVLHRDFDFNRHDLYTDAQWSAEYGDDSLWVRPALPLL